MGARYEPVSKERFSIEETIDGERIRIKAPRQIFAMFFLPFWLVMWTIGGVAALQSLITRFEPFLLFWLLGWAAGWTAVAGTLVWMFSGSELLRVDQNDLEIVHHALGFSRRWLYQGSQIKNLSVAPQMGWPLQFRWQIPFFRTSRNGSVKFDYGPRTVYVAAGLDEGEARMIVDRLARRLRPAAFDRGSAH